MVHSHDYGVRFRVSKKDYSKIEKRNNICINLFGYENGLIYLVYVLVEKFEGYIDLLLITHDNKSHYVYIKDFNRSVCNNTKHRNKQVQCSNGPPVLRLTNQPSKK